MQQHEAPEFGDASAQSLEVKLSFYVSTKRSPEELKADINAFFEANDAFVDLWLRRHGMRPHGLIVVDSIAKW